MHGNMRLRILGALLAGIVIAGIGVGVSSGLVSTSSHPHPNPTVAVVPNTRLVDLQTVLVVGSHFSANAFVASVECASNAVDESNCDLSTLVYGNANNRGTVMQNRFVRRIIHVGASSIDCAVRKSCILGVGNIANLTESAGAPISFNPRVPPVPNTLTADPATKLRDHQLVKVTGTGFSPGQFVQVIECRNDASFVCAYETARYTTAADDGTIKLPNYALERDFIGFDGSQEVTVDCATTVKTCVLEAQSGDFFGGTVNASLAFDRRVPPVIPALSVVPSTNLGDLQLVRVTGYGFLPGVQVSVAECTNATFACDPGSISVTPGLQGQFKLTMAVRRRIAGQTARGVVSTDCATHLGTCFITAFTQGFTPSPIVSLSFSKNKQSVKPKITGVPTSGLLDNQLVGVKLSGFTPFRPLAVVECSAETVVEQNLSYCDLSTITVTTTPAGGGDPSASFFVRRAIAGQNGLVNCASKPGRCVLVAAPFQYFGYIGVGIGGATNSRAAGPSRPAVAGPMLKARTLPAPTPGGVIHAAKGSSIPGIAVVALIFR
jgi:hypothetical protein